MSEEIEAPVRERTLLFVCGCRVGKGLLADMNSCQQLTSGPDEPICQDCIANKHDENPDFNPTIKRIEMREK